MRRRILSEKERHCGANGEDQHLNQWSDEELEIFGVFWAVEPLACQFGSNPGHSQNWNHESRCDAQPLVEILVTGADQNDLDRQQAHPCCECKNMELKNGGRWIVGFSKVAIGNRRVEPNQDRSPSGQNVDKGEFPVPSVPRREIGCIPFSLSTHLEREAEFEWRVK